MRIRNVVMIFLACISFSFSTFASEYDSLLKEYEIDSKEELEEALSMYWLTKNDYCIENTDELDEAIRTYLTVRDDYYIENLDDLENALYTYNYFDKAIKEEGRPRLSESQDLTLDEIYEEIDAAYEKGEKDGFRNIVIGIGILIIIGATAGRDYAEKHWI